MKDLKISRDTGSVRAQLLLASIAQVAELAHDAVLAACMKRGLT